MYTIGGGGLMPILHRDRNGDWEEIGYMKVCGSFHITPLPGQGSGSVVNYCSALGPGPQCWSRFRSV